MRKTYHANNNEKKIGDVATLISEILDFKAEIITRDYY